MKRLCLVVLAYLLVVCRLAGVIVSIGSGNTLNQGLPIEPVARYSYSQQIFRASEINVGGVIGTISFQYNVSSSLFFAGNRQIKMWLGHTTQNTISSWIPADSLYLVYDGMLSESDFSAGLPGTGWLNISLNQSFYYNGTDNLVLAVEENSVDYGSTSDDFFCTDSGQQLAIQYQSQSTNPDPYAPPATGYTLKTHRSNLRIDIQPLYYTPVQPYPSSGSTGVATDTNLSWVSLCDSFTLKLGTRPDSLEVIAENIVQCLWQPLAPYQNNHTYYWQVTGYLAGQPYPSAVWSFTTCAEPISPPRNLSGFYNGQAVLLSWQAPATGTAQSYHVYRNSQLLYSLTGLSYNDLDVQPGLTYYYYVTASNASGTESGASNNISVTIPGLPPGTILSQGFENCQSFSTIVPNWVNLDRDLSPTWGWDSVSYPHEGEALGWLVFAPGETSPPLTGFSPYSGAKMLMAMSSLNPPNNDWLISPAIHPGSNPSLSFHARSAVADFGLERLRVLVSVSDTLQSSFTALSSGQYLSVPVAWTTYTYDLSSYQNQRIYLAWQCQSVDAFALFLDEIKVLSTGGWVSVEDNCLPKPSFTSFPNPAKDGFLVSSKSGEAFSIEVFDLKGRKLYAGKELNRFDTKELGLNLASGVYLLRVGCKGTSQILKQVILK